MFAVSCHPSAGLLPLFFSCFPGSGPGWEDLVVAQDYGLLQPGEILAWLGSGSQDRPLTREMVECAESSPMFELALWSACRQVLGFVPRPGTSLWEAAQDRWRVVLLKHALAKAETPEGLGMAVRDIFEMLGMPEDMWGLWMGEAAPVANRARVAMFLKRLENRLSAKWFLPMPLAG